MAVPPRSHAYARALDATRDTLVCRSSHYRWLVVVVSSAGLLAGLGAWLAADGRWLLSLLMLPTAVMAFSALDLRAVQRWREDILSAWSCGDLRLSVLAHTLRQLPAVPAHTVTGMLDSLPAWPDEEIVRAMRPAICELQSRGAELAGQVLYLRAGTWVGACALIGVAWIRGELWGLPVGAGALLAGHWLWRSVWRARLTDLAYGLARSAAAVGVERDRMIAQVAGLCWDGVPVALRSHCCRVMVSCWPGQTRDDAQASTP